MKVERSLRRSIIRRSSDPRPSSEPFISGDSFRKIADHIFEREADLTPDRLKSVAERNVVFVASDLIEAFAKNGHPCIKHPYILITHNGDDRIARRDLSLLDDGKILAWFAQNAAVAHERLIPLPIGLENAHYANNGRTDVFKKITAEKDLSKLNAMSGAERRPNIIASFSIGTNVTVRKPLAELLKILPTVDYFPAQMALDRSPMTRATHLSRSMFIASPQGNGLDCHRTWEAMYVGTIPIVERSIAMEYFEKLGLPLWIIDDWSELSNFDAAALARKYAEIMGDSSAVALRLEYWKEAMRRVQ